MHGEGDVFHVRAHFQRQHRFSDKLTGIGAGHAGADETVALVEEHLGDAVIAADAERATAGGPGESALGVFDAFGLALLFGFAHPGDFRIGVGDRGNGFGVEVGFHAADNFGCNLAFVRGLVRQHRLADDVADGVDVLHIGFLLFVDSNETALINLYAGGFGVNQFAIGAAANREQHAVEGVVRRNLLALERNLESFFQRFNAGDFRFQPDVFVTFFHAFFQRPH